MKIKFCFFSALLSIGCFMQGMSSEEQTTEIEEVTVITNEPSEFSVADYIRLNGQPTINNGTLYLCGENITSLSGIEELSDKENITGMYLRGNALQLTQEDKKRFSLFKHLALLDLGGNELTSLPEDIFEELYELCDLQLDYNKLTALPVNIFKNLHKLLILNLSDNEFVILDSAIFNNLNNLKELHLQGEVDRIESRSCIKTIPTSLFNNLVNLEFLDLSRNFGIKELDPMTFSNLTRLKKLNLAYTSFTLKNGLMKNLTALEELDLSGCGDNIESGSFDGLTNLKTLDMGVGDLNFKFSYIDHPLPAQLFHPLTCLESLYLSNHVLKNLDTTAFDGLKNVKVLILDCLALEAFPVEMCKDLVALEHLSLEYNKITYLDPLLVESLPNIKTINLSGNALPEENKKELLTMNSEKIYGIELMA